LLKNKNISDPFIDTFLQDCNRRTDFRKIKGNDFNFIYFKLLIWFMSKQISFK